MGRPARWEHHRRRKQRWSAAVLRLVLRRFDEAHPDRPGSAGPRPPAGDARGDSGAPDDGGDRLAHALGLDATTAPWVQERVDAYLTAMLRHFGLDPAMARARFQPEMSVAETRCATCAETGRCRGFLARVAGAGEPSAFCPNAPLFGELRRHDVERSAAALP